MKTKVIALGLALALVPAVSHASTYSHAKPRTLKLNHFTITNEYQGFKHTKTKRYRLGTVTIYRP